MDGYYLAVLEEADAYAAREGLDLPEEPEAKVLGPLPECVTNPVLSLDLKQAGVTSIIWATGFSMDFGWLKVGNFDEKGRPEHTNGVSPEPGLYFLGLPWLTCRASSFICLSVAQSNHRVRIEQCCRIENFYGHCNKIEHPSSYTNVAGK